MQGRLPSPSRLLWPTKTGVQRLRRLLDDDLHRSRTLQQVPPSEWIGLTTAPALEAAVRLYDQSHESPFSAALLPLLIHTALRFPDLLVCGKSIVAREQREQGGFAGPGVTEREGTAGLVVGLNAPRARLTKAQVFCILSNAFLCTFASRRGIEEGEQVQLPTINYDEIHMATGGRVEINKLLMFFEYVASLSRLSSAELGAEGITILRGSAGDGGLEASRLDQPLRELHIHPLKESIDSQQRMIRVDFANRWVGGGSLCSGCVQEEITFSLCPELNVARWFHSPMMDDEALVMQGYGQYAHLTPGTYGITMGFGGPFAGNPRRSGSLLAVDALDFRGADTAVQYQPRCIDREVKKLLAGLQLPDLKRQRRVASGNWGCGVFLGDVELKLLIQWLACSIAGKVLHYFPFDEAGVLEFDRIRDAAVAQGMTCRELLDFLHRIERDDPVGELNVWPLLERTLAASAPPRKRPRKEVQ